MLNVAKTVRNLGGEAYTFSEKRTRQAAPDGHAYIGTRGENLMHRAYSVSTGISGTGSKTGTKNLINEIKRVSPDIIHLHNLHGWYINLPMLFEYIKKNNIKTVWTLHDCWGFTGQCSHFTMEKCDKWKTGCYNCPRYRLYPYTFVDRTDKMWQLKKEWFTGVQNLTIVTPSRWLGDLTKQSFLGEYDVRVINNGINLDVFKPTPSEFRKKYNLENKKIILGVASGWNYRKGLDVFIELSKRFNDDYKIVLVGTDDKTDKNLPDNILSIHRTSNQKELAEIYTVADVFFNPTREENFPTVNIEALACGTPVITFRTGGSPEIIDSETGCVIDLNDIHSAEHYIKEICAEKPACKDKCVKRAKLFDMNIKFQEYYDLFNTILV